MIIILELLCIPLLVYIFFLDLKNKIDAISICTIFLIVSSILNWFLYAFINTGLLIIPIQGIYEGNLNILGLFLAISPPVITLVISYIIFKIIDIIQLSIIKNKREKGE